MKIKYYAWDDLPMQFKVLAPYKKRFFTNGNEVLLVMMVLNPDPELYNVERDIRNKLFRHLANDMARGTVDQVPVTLYFWTKEA